MRIRSTDMPETSVVEGSPAGLLPPKELDPQIYSSVPIFNRPADLLALVISFMVFSWACCVLRFYIRLIVVRKIGWDDLFLFLALVCTTVGSVFLCIAPSYGYGQSIYRLAFSDIRAAMKFLYIITVPYPLSVTFIKIAILCQYLRIFRASSAYRLACKSLIAIIALWGSMFSVMTWIPCIPIAAYWDLSIVDAKCYGFGGRQLAEFMCYFVGQAVSNSALDFIVFLLPVRLYFRPGTGGNIRVSLLCFFAMGLCVNLCSFWRMAFVIKMYTAGEGAFDPTWYSPTVIGLAAIEAHLAAACAAIPVFWPSLERRWNRIFVTQTVSVTTAHGQLFSRPKDVEMQSMRNDNNDPALDASETPEGWEPFVGDETTGLGIHETVIESLSGATWFRKAKALFSKV